MSAPFINNTDPMQPGLVLVGPQGWIDEITAVFQEVFGADIDLSPTSKDGQLVAGIAARFNTLEQLLKQVYDSRSPDGAVGAALSRLVQINGINRKPPRYSTAPVTLLGDAGTPVPQGSLIGSNSDPNKPAFATTADLTIGANGAVSTIVQCTKSGPVPAGAGELSKILSVVTGWTAVANTADATQGANVEADPLLRARRAASVSLPSQSMLDGLSAALRNMTGVADARAYENTSGVPDSKGLPPHSIKVIVRPTTASDADIANTIWLKTGQGVAKVGAHSFDVTDGDGRPQTMRWDVASDVEAYVVVKLDRALPPSTLAYLEQQMGQAISDYFGPEGELPAQIGQNVAWQDLFTPINALGLMGRQGQPSGTAVYLGSSANPTTQANLVVPYNGIAVFDPSRITVVGP